MAPELTAKRRAEKELQKVQKGISDFVHAVAEGLHHPSMKQKMNHLEARRVELEAQLAANAEEPIRLHPGLSDVYRQKVASLTEALNVEHTRGETAAALRGLISEIRLVPEAGELVGELTAIMQLAENEKARTQGPGRSLSLVAGAGFEPAAFRL
jgi:site-specific DNA recombinase